MGGPPWPPLFGPTNAVFKEGRPRRAAHTGRYYVGSPAFTHTRDELGAREVRKPPAGKIILPEITKITCALASGWLKLHIAYGGDNNMEPPAKQ